MGNFSNIEKNILDYFFTSSDKEDTVYAAKQTLPQEIVGYIIGRASRAKETFREIFLKLWVELWNDTGVPLNFKEENHINEILRKISDKSFKFLNEYKLHNSLREVPHVAIFCDELSILQTKVWEHEVVAEYQEKSTRYRPFVASNVYLPNQISNELKDKINIDHNMLIETYNEIYEDTKKRDLARYLLPVGSKTAMACMASIRSWERIVGRMIAYPTVESTVLALAIRSNIKKVFDRSYSFEYNDDYVEKCIKDFSFISNDIDINNIGKCDRDQYAIIKKIETEDVYKINGLIDIGAHRDLQRHRSVIQNFPDYRPIYGYDKLIKNYIKEELYQKYSKCMRYFNNLFIDTYFELKDKENVGEIQYVALLGHMTKFWYITDRDRWQYIHDLRTGAPTQKATNPQTVHFSYSTWCKVVEEKIKKYDLQNSMEDYNEPSD